MVSCSECRRHGFAILLSSAILLMILVYIFIIISTTESVSTVARSGTYAKDCNEYTYNSNTGDLECVNRNKSSRKWLILIPFLCMALVPILILRNVYTKIIKLREGPPRRRQDSALERPLVAISTVSRDYNIVDTITSPSAPPHTIALPAGEEDAPPPEYLPPPAYNEC